MSSLQTLGTTALDYIVLRTGLHQKAYLWVLWRDSSRCTATLWFVCWQFSTAWTVPSWSGPPRKCTREDWPPTALWRDIYWSEAPLINGKHLIFVFQRSMTVWINLKKCCYKQRSVRSRLCRRDQHTAAAYWHSRVRTEWNGGCRWAVQRQPRWYILLFLTCCLCGTVWLYVHCFLRWGRHCRFAHKSSDWGGNQS